MTGLADGLHAVPPGKIASVVTHLEMTARPERVARALPTGVEITPASRPTIGWYRALYRRVGEPWLWFGRLLLDDVALDALLAGPDLTLLVIRRDGEEVGFAELDLRDPDAVEIVYFGLVPGATGAGLGGALMRAALEAAWDGGARRVWLHTCDLDDPRALPFYRRFGFRPFAREIEIADDPRLTGVLPRDACPQSPLIDPREITGSRAA